MAKSNKKQEEEKPPRTVYIELPGTVGDYYTGLAKKRKQKLRGFLIEKLISEYENATGKPVGF